MFLTKKKKKRCDLKFETLTMALVSSSGTGKGSIEVVFTMEFLEIK